MSTLIQFWTWRELPIGTAAPTDAPLRFAILRAGSSFGLLGNL